MERIEVYPYQRIKENPGRRWLGKKQELIKSLQKKKPGQWVPYKINLSEFWSTLFTVEVLILSLISFIMARACVLGELLPFMFAFIAAFNRKRPLTGIIMTAFALAALLGSGEDINIYSNIITLIVLLGILNNVKLSADRCWWGIPFLTVAIILLVKSLFLLVNGVSMYGEMVIVFEAIIAGILTFVFMVSSDIVKKRKNLVNFTFEDITAFLIIGIGIVMGVNGIELAGLSLSSILCRLGILLAALLWGPGQATMVGVMAGLIPSITSSIFTFSLGFYTVSGLLAGLFRSFGRIGIIIGFMLGTMAFSLFIPETQGAVLGIWETAVACILFFLLPESLKAKIGSVPALGVLDDGGNSLSTGEGNLKTETVDRIRNFARVFDEIASTLETPAQTATMCQENSYLNYLYDEISSGFCKQCLHYEKCWDKYCYKTSKEILELFTIAETKGSVTYEDCSPEFRHSCLYSRDIVNFINYLFASLRLNEYWKNKFDESCNMISGQMQGISRIMENLADDFDDKTIVDYSLKEKLKKNLKKTNINLLNLTPIRTGGGEQLYLKISMNACTDGHYCENNVASAISAALGEKMEVCDKKCPYFMGKGTCEFVLKRSCAYKVSSGVAQVGKEAICGDSFTVATIKECKELIALSDGMGVGEEACAQSQSAVRMLETLFEAGFDREVALNTINSTLLLRSSRDNFATMDIVMIDLYNADVDFIKTGSVPSFIKRGQQVEVISASSLPMGIMENIDVFTDTRRMVARDMLVMISDGVLDYSGSRSEADSTYWIQELLKTVDSHDPQIIAEMILNRAMSMCGGKPHDDMTVMCMYIDLNLTN